MSKIKIRKCHKICDFCLLWIVPLHLWQTETSKLTLVFLPTNKSLSVQKKDYNTLANQSLYWAILKISRCLKITEKVSFNIASETSYVYILSGQKFIKKSQNWSILASFWKLEACGLTVLPDRSVLIGQKLVENAKIQMRHFE